MRGKPFSTANHIIGFNSNNSLVERKNEPNYEKLAFEEKFMNSCGKVYAPIALQLN